MDEHRPNFCSLKFTCYGYTPAWLNYSRTRFLPLWVCGLSPSLLSLLVSLFVLVLVEYGWFCLVFYFNGVELNYNWNGTLDLLLATITWQPSEEGSNPETVFNYCSLSQILCDTEDVDLIGYWLIFFYCFTSHTRSFHSYMHRDVIIAREVLQKINLCSLLKTRRDLYRAIPAMTRDLASYDTTCPDLLDLRPPPPPPPKFSLVRRNWLPT